RGRRRRAHRVSGLRARASRARAAAAPGARHRRLAGRGALGARTVTSLFGLDPATYRPHAIHTGERTYTETNCYTDIVAERLHARGNEPLAAMEIGRASCRERVEISEGAGSVKGKER